MKKSILNLFIAGLSLLAISCQKSEPTSPDDDRQTISLALAFDAEIDMGTVYEPIASRAQSTTVYMNNEYQYFILQKQADGTYMVVEPSGEALLKGTEPWWNTKIDITKGTLYSNIVTTLRPGTYEIVLFTSAAHTEVNSKLKPGTIVPGPGSPADEWFAIKYMKGYVQMYMLGRDIFYGRKEFTVSKTDNLHGSQPGPVIIDMKRRTAKMRFWLQETTQAEHDNLGIPYVTQISEPGGGTLTMHGGVYVQLERKDDPSKPMPWGLDLWGRVWTDPNPPASENDGHTFIECYVDTYPVPRLSPFNGLKYYVGGMHMQAGGMYFFSDDNSPLDIRMKGALDLTYHHSDPKGYYDAAQHEFTLKNNHISGMVFKMTDQRREDPKYPGTPTRDFYILEPVYSSPGVLLDPAKLLEGNIFYAPAPTPIP